MSSKSEKERRKELLSQLLAEENRKFLNSLPIEKTSFKELFNFVNTKIDIEGCDHDLRFTKEYLRNKNLPIDQTLEWLRENGGFCDCEVLYNVEEKFED